MGTKLGEFIFSMSACKREKNITMFQLM